MRVLDDLSTGKRENLAHCADQVELMVGDVRDPHLVAEAAAGAWGVVHLAAVASVTRSLEDPVLVNDINVGGTVTLLAAAAAAHVERLVFASSCAVYGDPRELPVSESTPVEPLSPYAAGKACRRALLPRAGCGGGHRDYLAALLQRLRPAAGPRLRVLGCHLALRQAALSGSSCIVYGDGLQSRDFVYRGRLGRRLSAGARTCARAGRSRERGYGQQDDVARH